MPKSDKEYWEAFYARSGLTTNPSPFAVFCAERYVKPGQVLFEAGCGNGRDAVHLARAGALVTAIDQCDESVARLELANRSLDNLRFVAADFVMYSYAPPLDVFYSRFTLHAVGANDEKKLLETVTGVLSPGGYLLLEFRGRKNELNGIGRTVDGEEFMFEHEGHRRRFIDSEMLASRLNKAGLEILMAEEKPGFSPFQGKDETFARIIARSRRG